MSMKSKNNVARQNGLIFKLIEAKKALPGLDFIGAYGHLMDSQGRYAKGSLICAPLS